VHSFRPVTALTAAVIATLSAGVRLSTAIFSRVEVLLLPALAHVTNPDPVVEVPSANAFVLYLHLQQKATSVTSGRHGRLGRSDV
jgi:hypothetical protein